MSETESWDTYLYRKRIPRCWKHLHALLFVEPQPVPLGICIGKYSAELQNWFISICLLHSVLYATKLVDISDCQKSGEGLGITKWGQDYKALTVLYWSWPLKCKGASPQLKLLRLWVKYRTAVYPPFPPMSVLHFVTFTFPFFYCIIYPVFVNVLFVSLVLHFAAQFSPLFLVPCNYFFFFF